MITLHGRASNNISFLDALEKCNGNLADAVAILYSPSFCKFAKFENGKLMGIDDQLLISIFEARVFNINAELRWLNVLNGQGRAVLISDKELTKIFDDDEDISLTEILDTIPQKYLLWGQGVDDERSPSLPEGWSRLAAARIGTLDIPISGIKPNQRVKLLAKEYLGFCEGEAGEYGNVAVLEERLIGLKLRMEVKS